MNQTRRDRRHRARGLAVALAIGVIAAGCGEGFSPFNVLDKLRVLAIQAEPPSLAPGESTVINALVYEPDGDEIAYRWSWCPITAGRDTGYQCAVTEEQLREAAVEQGGELAGELVPSFELGSGETASFTHLVPGETLREICLSLISEDIPEFVPVPDCEEQITVTVRLDLVAGGETVTAVKDLKLYFDADGANNTNPALGAVAASRDGGGAIPFPSGDVTALLRKQEYLFDVSVPESAADSYTYSESGEQRRETLFMTWFITGGSTEYTRTTFFENDIPLEELGSNSWVTPDRDDHPEAQAFIFLVLQDERGGVGWTWREVTLGEAGQ